MVERRHLPLFEWGAELRAARKRRRSLVRRTLIVGAGLASLLATAAFPPVPRLVWNASASAPLGLYLVAPGAPVQRGDFVVAALPPAVRGVAAKRHYLPLGVPLVKRVAASAGDSICASGAVILINGRRAAARLEADRAGRPLPRWQGCLLLPNGSVFLLMASVPDSFDGRYFGATKRSDIIGKARLIWPR